MSIFRTVPESSAWGDLRDLIRDKDLRSSDRLQKSAHVAPNVRTRSRACGNPDREVSVLQGQIGREVDCGSGARAGNAPRTARVTITAENFRPLFSAPKKLQPSLVGKSKSDPFKILKTAQILRLCRELPASALKVWLYHYGRSGPGDTSFALVDTIALGTNQSIDTVKKARKLLRRECWLITVGDRATGKPRPNAGRVGGFSGRIATPGGFRPQSSGDRRRKNRRGKNRLQK